MSSATFRLNEFWRATAALTALSACLVASAAGAAYAAIPTATAPAVTVWYGDLNLASEQGASTLYARIVSAARAVCDVENADIRDLTGFARAKACEAQAIEAAVYAVHSPRLASLHAAQLRHG